MEIEETQIDNWKRKETLIKREKNSIKLEYDINHIKNPHSNESIIIKEEFWFYLENKDSKFLSVLSLYDEEIKNLYNFLKLIYG